MSQKQALINATELIIDHYHLIPVVQLLNEINQAKNWIFNDQDFNFIYLFLEQQVKKSIPVANDVVAIYQDRANIIAILHIANHYHKIIFATDLKIKQLKISFQNQWLTNLKTLLTKWKANQSYLINIDLDLNQMIIYDHDQIYWTNQLRAISSEKLLIVDDQNHYFHPDWLKLNHINFSSQKKIKFSKSIWSSKWDIYNFLSQHCFWNWNNLSWEFDNKLSVFLNSNIAFPPILKPIANFGSIWLYLPDQYQQTILTICKNANFKISNISLLQWVEFNNHQISFNYLNDLEQWSQDWFLLGQNSQNIGFKHRDHHFEIHFDHNVDFDQYWDQQLLTFINHLIKIDKDLKIKMTIGEIRLSGVKITNLNLAYHQITFIYQTNQLTLNANNLQPLISFIKDLLQPIRKLNLKQLTTIKLTYQDDAYHFEANCDDAFKINFSHQSDLTNVITKWKNVMTINAFELLAVRLNFIFSDSEYVFLNDQRTLKWISHDQISSFDHRIIKSYLKWWMTNKTSNLDGITFVNLIKPKRQVKWKQFNYVLTNHRDFPFQALIAQGMDWKHLNTFYANLYYAPNDVVLDRVDKLLKSKLTNDD